ncbi:MAG: molybdopterin-guanine dinucleotide biosynthesis protein B [Zhaonellaceae bacterium]|jgi:molybdopterin-guanine dinucleotide biosynthesis protein B|nr:molybdopterin-guanine dinucleotide biosynthesis protein B [Clostridia bacterium]
MIPIISFVGRSNSGKTTYIVKLIRELKSRGYRVAVIKHHHGQFQFDQPRKDTWLHAEAGADVVMISSPHKMAMIQKTEKELTLEEITSYLSNVDLLITEGYKKANIPKIEIIRSAVSSSPMCAEKDLLAIITDLNTKFSVPRFDFENVSQLTDFLLQKLQISMQVNGVNRNL